MINFLLAAALTFDCTGQIGSIENNGKVYEYDFSSTMKRELAVGGKTYSCTAEYPQRIGTGIRTLGRYRCGPLTLFFQTYYEECSYDDINPSPAHFDNYEKGKLLLEVQHKCIKTGMKFVSAWNKLRDKNGTEWDLEDKVGRNRRDICSSNIRTNVEQETFTITKTGDIIEFYEFTTFPIRSIKNEPTPSF